MMLPKQKIIAIAKLDGLEPIETLSAIDLKTKVTMWSGPNMTLRAHVPDYQLSYDAIMPVIAKQPSVIRTKVLYELFNCLPSNLHNEHLSDVFEFSPEQFCNALLKALGKFD